MDSIGERIKFLRNKFNLTQQDLADAIGVPRANISNYEKNRYKPASSALNALSKYFNVSGEWILTGKGPDPVIPVQEKQDPYKDRIKELNGITHLDGSKVTSRDKRQILKYIDGMVGDMMFHQADVDEQFTDEDIELLNNSLMDTYLTIRDLKRKDRLKKALKEKEKIDDEINLLKQLIKEDDPDNKNDKDDNKE